MQITRHIHAIKMFDYIRKTGRNPEDISLIILTHSHPDHIGSAHEIQRTTGCTIAAHHGERAWIEDVELQSRERPVPDFHSLVGGSVRIDRILSISLLLPEAPLKKRLQKL